MTKKIDPDVKSIRGAFKALMGSSNKRMLRANMIYLWDFFIDHPPKDMPPHLLEDRVDEKDDLQGLRIKGDMK